jgi:hypothetical protein
MRKLATIVALGAAFSLTPLIHADNVGNTHVKQVQEKKHHGGMKGTISSVESDSVVVSVTNKKTGEKKDHTVKTDASTKITLDGKDAKLTDLKAGQEVSITPGTAHGAPALAIEATSAAK